MKTIRRLGMLAFCCILLFSVSNVVAGPPPGRSDLVPEIVTQGVGGASMVAGGTVDWGAEVHVHVFVWFDNSASEGVETFDRDDLSAYLRADLDSCGEQECDTTYRTSLELTEVYHDETETWGHLDLDVVKQMIFGMDPDFDEFNMEMAREIPRDYLERIYDTLLYSNPYLVKHHDEEFVERLRSAQWDYMRYINGTMNQYEDYYAWIPLNIRDALLLAYEYGLYAVREGVWITFSIQTEELSPGDWEYFIEIDRENLIDEEDESNNLTTSPYFRFTVQRVDPVEDVFVHWPYAHERDRRRENGWDPTQERMDMDTPLPVTAKRVMYGDTWNRTYCTNTSYSNFWSRDHIQNFCFRNMMVSEYWTPCPVSNVRNVFVFLTAQQIGDNNRSVVTGSPEGWGDEEACNNHDNAQCTVNIVPGSMAWQIINQQRYWQNYYTPSDTLLVIWFEHEDDKKDNRNKRRDTVQGVYEHLRNLSGNFANTELVYLAGASRGGVMAIELAKKIGDYAFANSLHDDMRIIVSALSPCPATGPWGLNNDEIGVTGELFNTPYSVLRECRWANLDTYLGDARRVKELDIYSSLDRSALISRMACYGRSGQRWYSGFDLQNPARNYGTHERPEWGAGEWDIDDPRAPRRFDFNPQPGGYNFFYWQRWHDIAHTDLTRPWRCDTAGQQLRFFFQRAGFGVFDEWGLDDSCGKLPGSCFQKCGTYVKGDESTPEGYHCWCDPYCHQYGDCCWDKVRQCGGSCYDNCGNDSVPTAEGDDSGHTILCSCTCDCHYYGNCCPDMALHGCDDCGEIGEQCWDGTDNDGNGLTDCDDPLCSSTWCSAEYECWDAIDNDDDGLMDCDDPDCAWLGCITS